MNIPAVPATSARHESMQATLSVASGKAFSVIGEIVGADGGKA